MSRRARHDLRTPLNQIIGYTEMVLEDAQDGGLDAIVADLTKVRTAAHDMLRLIDVIFSSDDGASPAVTAVRPATPAAPGRLASVRPEDAGRILVVDDDALNRDVLQQRLERLGHTVHTAAGGAEALAMLEQLDIDLILLDVMMPELAGDEVLARLKAGEHTRHLPVVMISAMQGLESVARCIELGAEDYLPKPFDPVILRARVGASLEKKRLRDKEEAYRRDIERANLELRQTQARLVQSEKMASLGRLVAGIAHEFNTPMGAMESMLGTLSGATTRLRERVQALPADDARTIERLLGVIDNANSVFDDATRRVSDIVRRLRRFARLDEAKLKRADVNEGIVDTLALFSQALPEGVEVRKDLGELPTIACFPAMLNQALLAMLSNACDAVGTTGVVEVRTLVEDGRVQIHVRDNGCGIPESDRPHIFDPGFTTKGVGVGVGLGLSICYQIVQDHHGELVLDEPGEWTTFTILLPMDLDSRLEQTTG